MMHVGFTGTQKGMSQAQEEELARILKGLPDEIEFHHGDCIGADEEAHNLVRKLKPRAVIHGHPGRSKIATKNKRAYCDVDVEHETKDYLVRNMDIVKISALLLATPGGSEISYPRSGTWATVRRSRHRVQPRIVIAPDGERVEEQREQS